MRTRKWLFAIWLCFLSRSAFYSAAWPLWEGFDEWAHFSVIQRMALRGELLVSREAPVPRDVQASLDNAPVPWELRHFPSPSVTQDDYWRLPAIERQRREEQFGAIPISWAGEDGGLRAYEALQPPLYYWLMAPALRLVSGAPLAARVFILRYLSAAIASLVIPLAFVIGRLVFADDRMALGCAAVIAAMPEFAIDVARVGNECVAVVLFTALTCMALKVARDGLNYGRAACIGTVLGLGLLAKAYFLTAVPALAVLSIQEFRRARGSRIIFAGFVAVAIAGWWYVRNLVTTGTLSGLNESVMLRGRSMFGHLLEVRWPAAVDSILFSHIWFGGWSSLTVRSWMYHVFYAMILLAIVGLAGAVRKPGILALLSIYLCFWAGELYNVLLLYLSKGIATSMGWYMYAVIGCEVTLCIAGLRALLPARWSLWIAPAGVLLFALFDLYTLQFIAIPYYTGIIAHRSSGAIAAVHLRDMSQMGMGEVLHRLTAYKGAFMNERLLAGLWILYEVSTIALPVISGTYPHVAKNKP